MPDFYRPSRTSCYYITSRLTGATLAGGMLWLLLFALSQ